jgi:hypothetical protein
LHNHCWLRASSNEAAAAAAASPADVAAFVVIAVARCRWHGRATRRDAISCKLTSQMLFTFDLRQLN